MKTKKQLTLCLIERDGALLLGLKKRGFGQGKWNGFGGKVSEGETIEQATRRELTEEAGIEALGMEKVGEVDFEFEGDPVIMEVHIYRAFDFSGEPVETEEMKPQWYPTDALPFENMWIDDPFWMPFFLSGKKFRGSFLYDGPDKLLKTDVWEVSGF